MVFLMCQHYIWASPVRSQTAGVPIAMQASYDSIPYCIDVMPSLFEGPIALSEQSPPDFNSASIGCKLRLQSYVVPDGTSLELSQPVTPKLEEIAQNSTSAMAWATNINACCTNNNSGASAILGLATTQRPTIPLFESWENYRFYNRIHVGSRFNISACTADYETLSIGILTGRIAGLPPGVTLANELISERLLSTCVVNRSNPPITFQPPGAVAMIIGRSGTNWRSAVWLSGMWVIVDDVSTSWPRSSWTEYGQEIWVRYSQDLGKIAVPLSFIHKATLTNSTGYVYPWHDRYLPAPLAYSSYARADAPWHVPDLIGEDFTSMSACTHCQ